MIINANAKLNRISFLKVTALLALLITFLISLKLWHSNRNFPTAPILNNVFYSIPIGLNYIILGTILLSAGIALFINKPFFFLVFTLITSCVLILLDITRLQPEFYMFFSFVFLLTLYYKNTITENTLLNTSRLIICCVYFASGISKLNPYFNQIIYQWMIYPLNTVLSPAFMSVIQKGHLLIPLSELFIAIALLVPKLRNAAIVLVCILHVSILILLSPIFHGFNYIVFPWNISMIAFVFILFYRNEEPTFNLFIKEFKQRVFKLFILLYFIIPILQLFGFGDMYLSFSV
jgi:hypothetical protein